MELLEPSGIAVPDANFDVAVAFSLQPLNCPLCELIDDFDTTKGGRDHAQGIKGLAFRFLKENNFTFHSERADRRLDAAALESETLKVGGAT